MKTLAIVALLALLIPASFGVGTAQAQTTVTVDAAALTFGYMNVFELPVNGGGFVFGSAWGLPDLSANFVGDEVTVGPNFIGDPNEFWYQCTGTGVAPDCGSPGALGNKIMEANVYAEDTGTYNGQTVTFEGIVIANSLTSAHTVVAFVKDYAPDYSSFVQNTVPLSALGSFSVSLATINDAGRHVQWGFQTVGENVWVTDLAPFGTMTIGPEGTIPTETTSWGAIKALY